MDSIADKYMPLHLVMRRFLEDKSNQRIVLLARKDAQIFDNKH